MKLEGFEEFSFCGTPEQQKELIEIHERNGCRQCTANTVTYERIYFDDYESYGGCDYNDGKIKSYAEAKAYLLSFAKPTEPAKPKRKKAVAVNQGFEIDDTRYTKTHINYVPVAEVKQQLKFLRLKLDRYTRLDKAGALDNR